MTDKQIIIDEIEINPNDWLLPYKDIPACEVNDCDYSVYAGNGVYGCRFAEDGLCCDDFNNPDEACMYRQLEYYKEALKRKEQECEELRQYHNKCCEEFEKEKKEWLEKYNQLSRDFYNGKYCNKENCSLLKAKEQECEELKAMQKDLSYKNQKFSYQIEEQTKQLEPFKDEYFKGLETIVIAELAKKSIRITTENRKLEQTLTEIKEIAEKIDDSDGCAYGDYDCDNCSSLEQETVCTYKVKKLILQKISEVEDGQ